MTDVKTNDSKKDSSIITLSNVSKIYGYLDSKFKAVDNASLSVSKGDFVALLGPNGAGKSTIMKMLANVISPSEGSVLINGYDVRSNPRDALRDVGCQVDVQELNTALSPRKFCEKMGLLSGLDRETVLSETERVLDAVDMIQWGDQSIKKFSKGMKQRICVAQSLIGNPKTLLMDEPMSGIDPESIFAISSYLKKLRKTGDVTLVISTHDMEGIEDLCTSVAFLKNGRILRHDPTSELYAQERRRQVFVSTRSHFDSSCLDALYAEDYVLDASACDFGARIWINGNNDTKATLFNKLTSLGLGVLSVVEENKMETVYAEVMGGT